MSPTIRKAKIDDLNELQTLFVETIRATCTDDYSSEQIDAWTSSVNNTERWESIINDQFCIVAEIEVKIVGFASLRSDNYIDMIYVHKDFQNIGIASKLFKELTSKLKDLPDAAITVDASKTALPFFKSKGFKVIKENILNINGVSISNYKMRKSY